MHCQKCNYSLDNVSSGICPHCGAVNSAFVSSYGAVEGKKPWFKMRISGQQLLAVGLVLLVILALGSAVVALHAFSKKKPATMATQTASAKPQTSAQTAQPVKTVKSDAPPTHAKEPAVPPKTTAVAPKTPVPVGSCYQVAGISSRSNIDRPDTISGYQIHIIYALASDDTDNHYDTNGRIASSVSSWDNWLCQQTGGKYLRLDTYNGALDVSFIRFNVSDNTIKTGSDLTWATNPNSNPYVREDIQKHVQDAGFTDPNKLYAVYYDGSSNFSCGGGAYPPSLTGHVAAEYMHGGNPASPDCSTNNLASSPSQSPGYFDYDLLHELVHTLGFVPSCAPHNTQTAHVSDNTRDLMYAGSQPWGVYQGLILDYNHDDYYSSNIPGCLDLKNSAFLVGGGSQLPPSW